MTGEITDDDTVAGFAIEKAFVGGQRGPLGARAADGNVVHGVVVDDFVPEIFYDLIETVAIVR